ncbi:MAG: papain fold toxin domain-containing protein [Emticicia sp.]|nr:papain fold toxin domain-containing protein [Emticicia sp.]
MSKVGVTLSKTGSKAAKFVIRKADGTELRDAFQFIDGIYKNVKKKTATHNVFLGYIDGQVQFQGANEKINKVRCKLWGKCRPGSSAAFVTDANFRADANAANDCNVIDDVAGELDDLIQKVRNLSSNVPDKWKKPFKCVEYSSDLRSKLINAGIKGEELTMRTGTGFIQSNSKGQIATNGLHKAIKVDNMVFDNFRTEGISYDDWINDLGGKLYTNPPYAEIKHLKF